jgi:hypothetical protein
MQSAKRKMQRKRKEIGGPQRLACGPPSFSMVSDGNLKPLKFCIPASGVVLRAINDRPYGGG